MTAMHTKCEIMIETKTGNTKEGLINLICNWNTITMHN